MDKADISVAKPRKVHWLSTVWNSLRRFLFRTVNVILVILFWIKDWTGLFSFTDAEGKRQRGKTLWDWMGLLIVPAVLAVGAIWFNNSQQTRAQEIARDQVREEILHAYFNEMEDLLLHGNLLAAKGNSTSPVLIVAQVKTVTALRSLDQERQARILQFIRDSGLADFMLIGASFQKVNMSNCDFSGITLTHANLIEANLSGADLSGVDLNDADLSRANLSGADLIAAHLSRAHLGGANLNDANLRQADLKGADLIEAHLSEATLWFAYLNGAHLDQADLSEATLSLANLSGAYLSRAKLNNANLHGANLSGADLSEANLSGADLSDADLSGVNMRGATAPDVQ